MTRAIRFLVYPGFVLFDLSGPLEVFNVAAMLSGGAYGLSVISIGGGPVVSSSGIAVVTEAPAAAPCDTLIVPGSPAPLADESADDVAALLAAMAPDARRVASVCTGAFLLGAARLLDGRRATTHWFAAPHLQARHPTARIDADRIFVQDGAVWTSAGMSSGIDMALALVEEDLGADLAQQVARMLVVYCRRPGGQTQFSSLLDLDPGSDRIRRTLSFARENLSAELPVDRLAEVAGLSTRQFARAFGAATGLTPARAIERLRIEAARPLVEDGRRTFDEIARETGFGDPERMCQGFVRTLGRTPQDLRRDARRAQTFSR
ncbi:GlxA family transcriptional regulator [Zavarzinia compransoris]|uniref:GlxA family transcriptional regulator n=1 Tax=Zavarzinia marina TaxID=2911065 RepID=UPI001F3B6C0C|nr:GlxA family transcriptional regulator [Zavarzinia marina]MCF4165491.1 GlxA family transcriptional regulator [Zavarzinia marina]